MKFLQGKLLQNNVIDILCVLKLKVIFHSNRYLRFNILHFYDLIETEAFFDISDPDPDPKDS